MVRQFYIDNQRVDLPDDVRFQLTFQIADFGELKPRGSGSNTIKLPKTPRNVEIFERCNFVAVDTKFPYALHSAYYYEDGWLIFNDATVYLLAITDKDFEIQCTWGNSTEIARLKSIDMGNVSGLGNVNYGVDVYATIETGMKDVQGEFQQYNLAVIYNRLYSYFTRGLMSVKTALSAIGVSVNNISEAILSYLNDLYVFPAVKSVKLNYRNVRYDYPQTRTNIDPTNSDIEPIGALNGSLVKWKETGNVYGISRRNTFVFNPTRNDYTSGGRDDATPLFLPGQWYDVELNVEVYALDIFNADTANASFNRSNYRVCVVFGQAPDDNDNPAWNSSLFSTVQPPRADDSNIVITANNTSSYPIHLSAKKRIYCDGREVNVDYDEKGVAKMRLMIFPYISTSGVNSNVYGQVQASANISVTAVKDNTVVDIVMPEETTDEKASYLVRFNDVLRGISAFDFLTQSVLNVGALFDFKDGQMRVFTYNDIANNDPLDWSNKLISIDSESIYNQSAGGRNLVKYKPFEQYSGFGDGSFSDNLASGLKKADKTVAENSLFGFVNGDGKSNGYVNVASLPFVYEKADDKGLTYEFKDSGIHLVKLGVASDVKLVNRSNKAVYGNNVVRSVSDTQPTFSRMNSVGWSQYISMQQRYRMVKATFRLTGRDMAELDVKKPIYLHQTAQIYVITKVDYQPGKAIVDMMLL